MKKISVAALGLFSLLIFGRGQSLNAQTINTYAGTGVAGHTGDGGLATAAQLNHPHGNTIDAAGNVYVCDYGNNCIRKITPSGIITNIAGNGVGASSADGAVAATSSVYNPFDVVVDNTGNVYFTECAAQRVRMINTSGILSTIAGNGSTGATGDGGPATAATLSNPAGIARDAAGNIYISVQYSHKIRKIATTGIITTVAGTGSVAFGGDGGPATAASFSYPNFLALDNAGNLLITDNGNFRIRKLDVTTGIINTIAGNGSSTFSGDGGPATAASLYYPGGVAVNAAGEILIGDNLHNRIRLINSAGTINTVAGNGVAGYSGDGGPATSAKINGAVDVCYDATSNFYISDFENQRVRVVSSGIIAINHPPVFNVGNSTSFTVCENSLVISVPALDITDIDAGQTETFSVISGPIHGTLAGFPASMPSTGGSLVPFGITYSPTTGYAGIDTFTIIVSDGALYDTLAFHVDVLPVTAGSITGPDSLCPGDTVVLFATIPAGAWSSTNVAIASVTTAGLVIGNAPGTVSINYTISNSCTTAVASHIMTVRSIAACSPAPNHPPIFTADGSGYLNVCENSSMNHFGFLDASDIDLGQTETYSVLVAPNHGTLAGFPTSVISTGGVFTPIGVTYTPTGLYYGTDTFTIVVSDGSGSDTIPFHVNVFSNTGGVIVGPDVVCIGSSISLTDYITGGIWSSANNTLATVSATGVVLGIAAGVDTIRYSVPNICNAGPVMHLVTVLTPEECAKLAVNNIGADNTQLSISPNPNNGSFTVNYAGRNDAKIVVSDMTGRKIANYEMTANKPLDIHMDVAPGIYFLSAFDGVSVQTVKMVVVQ
ncbi:hypothetical protein CJD36_020715 [Flavipsychrobacter stenotrophus]|uniref:Uncharacterized protein n=1 Tax=Flavipsychrobacter stenotrophus TaxID=2077091 RepID=A0A2S7SRF0_9BACT|nr:Ig-like domain-containing protein [Flavipsychrobacter stenotrophus]PQJ09211.1 hypothetical protein CJD36_020715 [Flavipsychrobacter stenotrophus]